MIDIRTHIYSLAAVFLALAIGIIIGTSFSKSLPSDSGGRRTIQRYENSMRDLKGEIIKSAHDSAQKDAALRGYEQYCRSIMPIAVNNKLYWRNVAVIQTGDSDDLTGSVKKALETAGAQITCVVDINDAFPFSDDNKVSNFLINNGLGSTSSPKSNRDKLFKILANTVCSEYYQYLIPTFEKAGIAVFSGDCKKSCKLVVLVGGASSESKNMAQFVDEQLLARFEKQNITVVGCETTNAAISYIPIWHKAGIATVDNADSAMGQTSLIYALNGETANFGTKETADRLIPKTMEPR